MLKFFSSKNLIFFLLLFAVYVSIVLLFSDSRLMGDETRHLQYAENLIQGFYTNADNPEFRNGPGYPLVIAPLKFLGVSHIIYKLLNTFFMIFAVMFFYKSISLFLKTKFSLLFSLALGLYPPSLKWMVYIYSESLTVFLACGFLFYLVKAHKSSKKKISNWVVPGLFLGMLVLTKVLFAYVLVMLLAFCAVLYFIAKSKKVTRALYILGTAFALCTPYLAYTYSSTGKIFFWGTGGGEILYWRSTPFADEYGDWISSDIVVGNAEHRLFQTEGLKKNHGQFIESLENYSHVERDSVYKAKAIENIKKHPDRFIQNTAASAGRLFFNFPYSYTPQKMTTFFYVIPNMFLVVFLLIAVYLALTKRNTVAFETWLAALIALIYIAGLIALNGMVRHLIPVIPLLFYFIVNVFHKSVKISVIKN